MTCRACAVARQIGLNAMLMLDMTGNALLGGNPRETISRRTARAALAGERWAMRACRALTAVFRALGSEHNHCRWALQAGSIGAEVWHWSEPDESGSAVPVGHSSDGGGSLE